MTTLGRLSNLYRIFTSLPDRSVSCFHVKKIFNSSHRNYSTKPSNDNPRILITGGLGQLGVNFSRMLRKAYGSDNVILSDIVRPSEAVRKEGPFAFVDVLDFKGIQKLIVNEDITWVVHLSALISAVAEQNTGLAMRVNIEGLHNVLEAARQYHLRLFVPSTIGAFGPSSPRVKTPDVTIMKPNTMYGVTKVYAELQGEYYHKRYNLDFRCLRLPGVISSDSNPGGGTTDYAVHIFHEAIRYQRYLCYLRPDTRMPMIYIDDCLRGIHEFLSAPAEKLRARTYNLAAISFTPEELAAEMIRQGQSIDVEFKPDFRQDIADSWPQSLDDQLARNDWGWRHEYDISKLVETMLNDLRKSVKISSH